jgi:uncharacterized protein (TIGR01777 family)
MKIALTGATGFVGRALTQKLLANGHDVTALVRSPERAARALPPQVARMAWNEAGESDAMEGAGALIHLAGESVAGGRWTRARRRRIHESRGPALARLLESAGELPGVIISASAVGIYGDRGDEELTENSPAGGGFLAEVCQDWEAALQSRPAAETRRVALRIGMVLGRGGGAMARLLPVFRMGLGGRLGQGRQWMSWIHLEDLTELILFALETPGLSGAVNAVSPQPVSNREFTEAMAKAVGRPAFFHAPAFALRLALGQMSGIMLDSQRVLPAAALEQGFTHRYTSLEMALEEVCAARR